MGTPDYPANVKSFTTKQDGIDTVVASHVNALQDEVVALQSQVGVVSELPSLNLPSTSGTGAAVANRVGPQISGLKQWADHLNTYKAPLLSPTFEGTVTLPATTSIGNLSSTELGYLDGLAAPLQAQLNTKIASTGGTFTGQVVFTSGLWTNTVNNAVGGDMTLNANGGKLLVKSAGNLTNIKIAQGVAADEAVRRDQLDYVWASALNFFLSPDEEFYGNLRTLNGTFYQRHTNVNDKYSVINLEHYTASYGSHYHNHLGWNANPDYSGPQVPSSRELKNDITVLSGDLGSALFAAIDPVSFTYKTHEEDPRVPEGAGGASRMGFIAEDVREAGVPIVELVTIPLVDSTTVITDDDRTLGLSIPDLLAVLWSKVKEQDQRIADLEGAK